MLCKLFYCTISETVTLKYHCKFCVVMMAEFICGIHRATASRSASLKLISRCYVWELPSPSHTAPNLDSQRLASVTVSAFTHIFLFIIETQSSHHIKMVMKFTQRKYYSTFRRNARREYQEHFDLLLTVEKRCL